MGKAKTAGKLAPWIPPQPKMATAKQTAAARTGRKAGRPKKQDQKPPEFVFERVPGETAASADEADELRKALELALQRLNVHLDAPPKKLRAALLAYWRAELKRRDRLAIHAAVIEAHEEQGLPISRESRTKPGAYQVIAERYGIRAGQVQDIHQNPQGARVKRNKPRPQRRAAWRVPADGAAASEVRVIDAKPTK